MVSFGFLNSLTIKGMTHPVGWTVRLGVGGLVLGTFGKEKEVGDAVTVTVEVLDTVLVEVVEGVEEVLVEEIVVLLLLVVLQAP